MLVGGADTHRHDLSSMVMLKDNHVVSTGSITAAVKKGNQQTDIQTLTPHPCLLINTKPARLVCGFSMKIEVECQSQSEGEEAIRAGADVVMLDNFAPDELKEAAENLKKSFPHILIEASGGITAATIADYFHNSVDVISLGGVTQGVPHVDYSLKIRAAK